MYCTLIPHQKQSTLCRWRSVYSNNWRRYSDGYVQTEWNPPLPKNTKARQISNWQICDGCTQRCHYAAGFPIFSNYRNFLLPSTYFSVKQQSKWPRKVKRMFS